MSHSPGGFQDRTKRFALRCIRLANSLPAGRAAEVIGRQLLRSATSVGANYRAACRARTTAEFVSKLGIVEEEADEAGYWLELLVEAELVREPAIRDLHQEAKEILAMVVASINTARRNGRRTTKSEPRIRNPQSAIRNSQ